MPTSVEVEGELITNRQSKYNSDMCTKIIDAATKGKHITGMMLAINCKSKATWYKWQEEHPEFKEAVEYSKHISQGFYEELGLLGTTGQIKNFSATTYALIMNNKFKEDYIRSASSPNTEITYNHIELSPEETTRKIAQLIEKFKGLGLNIMEGNLIEHDSQTTD